VSCVKVWGGDWGQVGNTVAIGWRDLHISDGRRLSGVLDGVLSLAVTKNSGGDFR
jgi:hypothetical protein